MYNHPSRFEIADTFKFIVTTRCFWTGIFITIIVAGVLLMTYGGERSIAIGTSLVASGIVAIVTILVDFVRSGEQLRVAELSKAGILAVYPRRDLEEYDNLVLKSYQIDVSGYTLRSFTEANIGHIRNRISSGNPIKIRMILVEPSSEIAKAMEKNEGQSDGAYALSQEGIFNLLKDLNESVEVRLLDFPLPAMIYRIDDILYTGPYPTGEPSKLATTFKVSTQGWIYEKTMKEFENLWKVARPKSIQSKK